MTPRWLTVEKLVVELGGVCSSRYEMHGGASQEAVPEEPVDEAVGRATDAVTAVLCDPTQDDTVVRVAWAAIAQAQDAIGRLRVTVERARALRERAQRLQDQSLRLRGDRPPSSRDGSRPARRGIDRD